MVGVKKSAAFQNEFLVVYAPTKLLGTHSFSCSRYSKENKNTQGGFSLFVLPLIQWRRHLVNA